MDLIADERERQTREIASPSHAADDDIWIFFPGDFELLLRLKSDDRLVKEDMV